MLATVEGWSNLQTWAINLAIDNDSKSLSEKVNFIKTNELNAETVRWFVTNLYPKGVADCRRGQYNKVNWDELAKDWNIQKPEILLYQGN